jgi:hypothetical protein
MLDATAGTFFPPPNDAAVRVSSGQHLRDTKLPRLSGCR